VRARKTSCVPVVFPRLCFPVPVVFPVVHPLKEVSVTDGRTSKSPSDVEVQQGHVTPEGAGQPTTPGTGTRIRRAIGWLFIVFGAVTIVVQIASVIGMKRPPMAIVGYLLCSAAVIVLGVSLASRRPRAWRYGLLALPLFVSGYYIAVHTDPGLSSRDGFLVRVTAEAQAQYQRGVQCERGDGVVQDFGQAMTWYRKAADGGHPGAQFAIASLYRLGKGVPRDDQQVLHWTRQAADGGLTRAQLALGTMYESGQGVERDPAEAFAWVGLAVFTVPPGAVSAGVKSV